MFKKLVFICLVFLNSFGAWFDDRVYEYKKWFLNKPVPEVSEYLYDYIKDNSSVINRYFTERFSYNYGYKGDMFYLTIKIPDDININNHTRLYKFVSNTRRDIQKLLCRDYIFKASLYTNVKLKFEIYNTYKKGREETIYYNRNSVLACGLL